MFLGAGICTVFGDPHYKTFDGKFFSFQGSCKYQLTADCYNHSFSIRVTNDGRGTKTSSWTKTVTLKINGIKVNLGQKLRIKVNGTRIMLPYQLNDTINVQRSPEGITVSTSIGVKLIWDGNNFLQVHVPATYKNKVCGLCGNYNNIWRDDLTSRRGINFADENVWRFANSWQVGGTKACARKHENLAKTPVCRYKKGLNLCKPLKESEVFENCGSRLNSYNYFESCKKDMCECPSGKCYCDSFAAYAHECLRLGARLSSDWKSETGCNNISNILLSTTISPSLSTAMIAIPNSQIRRHRKKTKKPNYLNKHVPKTFLIHKHNMGRTPPPIH